MNKTDMLCAYMAYDDFDSFMWERWFSLREKRAQEATGTEDKELWRKVLDGMPAAYTIDVSVSDQKVTFEHCGGVDEYPLSEFFYEDDGPDVVLITRGTYWDGPITGTCTFNGTEANFEMIDDQHQNRKYAAVDPKTNEKLGEFYWFDFKHYQQPRGC